MRTWLNARWGRAAGALVLIVAGSALWRSSSSWRGSDQSIGTVAAIPAGWKLNGDLSTVAELSPDWTVNCPPPCSRPLGKVRAGIACRVGARRVCAPAVAVGERWLDLFGGDYDSTSLQEVLHSWGTGSLLLMLRFEGDWEHFGDLIFLGSDDGGRTYTFRSVVPWPSGGAYLTSTGFNGNWVVLRLELKVSTGIAKHYWSLSDWFHHLVDRKHDGVMAQGDYAIRSSDRGRTFALELVK
jgi:hypothetical protein